MEHLNEASEQSARTCFMSTQTCCNTTLNLRWREWLSEAMNGSLTCWTKWSQKAKQS